MTTILVPSIVILCLAAFAVVLALLIWKKLETPYVSLREEIARNRDETAKQARDLREELANMQRVASESLIGTLVKIGEAQREQLKQVAEATERLRENTRNDAETLREKIETKLTHLQEGNERKLDQMRQVVDERLQTALEKRLGESFKLVSTSLEAVQRGLGEMQALAHGVGDLKRVLTNVKARGEWGEVRLEAILSEILTPDQYERNIKPVPDSGATVEFAIRLPGKGPDSQVWLPIDSKFPKENYERLLDASDASDADAMKQAADSLARNVREQAKMIRNKYIAPPHTTDFAIMFLPTEGLYAEVLRQPGLHEELHRSYRVLPAGPTVLSAMLNSLRMGFQTLAIEKRSAEVWNILSAVKTEMGKFSDMLMTLKKHLDSASSALEKTTGRVQQVGRKLRSVETMPITTADQLLDLDEKTPDGEDDRGTL